jgi:SAM-dependent methyltransferase
VPTAGKAERAASFGRVACEYERGRPECPREAIEWLLGVQPLEVLDLGAGTGKLTGGLLAVGHRVIAVEPLPEMREILAARLPDAQVLDGRAEQLPLADASVDAVTAAVADARAALPAAASRFLEGCPLIFSIILIWLVDNARSCIPRPEGIPGFREPDGLRRTSTGHCGRTMFKSYLTLSPVSPSGAGGVAARPGRLPRTRLSPGRP